MQCVGTKIDNGLRDKVMERCNGQGCSISEYLRNLILEDLNEDNQIPKAKITSIDDIPYENGEIRFEDEG